MSLDLCVTQAVDIKIAEIPVIVEEAPVAGLSDLRKEQTAAAIGGKDVSVAG